MTYNELAKMIERMPSNKKDTEITIFVYCNGELEMLNGMFYLGEQPFVEGHCDDFSSRDSEYPVGYPYLMCGLSISE